MNIVTTLLTVVFVLIAIAVTVLVLLQEGKSNGLSGSIGGGSSESYWGKNKSRSGEAKMAKFTSMLTVLFMIIAIVLNILM